jgi:hypothetical protein
MMMLMVTLEMPGRIGPRMNADGWGVVCQRMNDRPALHAKPKRRQVAALQNVWGSGCAGVEFRCLEGSRGFWDGGIELPSRVGGN